MLQAQRAEIKRSQGLQTKGHVLVTAVLGVPSAVGFQAPAAQTPAKHAKRRSVEAEEYHRNQDTPERREVARCNSQKGKLLGKETGNEELLRELCRSFADGAELLLSGSRQGGSPLMTDVRVAKKKSSLKVTDPQKPKPPLKKGLKESY